MARRTVAKKKPTKAKKVPAAAKPRAAERTRRSRATAATKRADTHAEPGREAHFIVGVGASAGGLEALRALFASLKHADHLSFIVVQHLAPLHRSRLVELIGHSTSFRVKEATESELPQIRTIYITPPNRDVFFKDGRIHLTEPSHKIGPKPSIDVFLRSLAEDRGEEAVGIILSGTGSDGASGMRAIKSAGGLTIVQTPSTAKYDGMPKAAKATGAIDLELSVEEIAKQLSRLDRLAVEDGARKGALDATTLRRAEPYELVLQLLEKKTGVSFAQYKQSTIRRRLERRMIATGCDSLEDYAELLRRDAREAQALLQDVLISVTSFFRDSSAFRAIGREISTRIEQKAPGSNYRVWSVGCATGEEAYSLAILLSEAIEKLDKPVNFQIFATDLDEAALLVARKGVYPRSSVEEVPKELLEKYFVELEDRVQVKPSLRERVVFARHNVVEDPPFLSLDLVSCRNVLIYFTSVLQEKVFRIFNYALDAKGLLFLGRSEAVPSGIMLFDPFDRTAKIYSRAQRKGELPRASGLTRPELSRETTGSSIYGRRETQAAPDLFNSLVASVAPDSVLVDEAHLIRHVYGAAARFLRLPRGEVTQTITRLVPAELSAELSAMLQRATKVGRSVQGRRHELALDGKSVAIQQSVYPIFPAGGGQRQYLVAFAMLPEEPSRPAASSHGKARARPDRNLSAAERIAELERELVATREHLQTIIEEQETGNEELQALNEELQSTNEELQSANEEMETTNEELQSSNEELTTLNEEINIKSGELIALNQRLQAIQNAIVYPLLILDRKLQLLGFNPSSRFLFRVGETDLGTHVRGIQSFIDMSEVMDVIEAAARKQEDAKLQFRAGQRSFEVRVQVFRGEKNEVQGLVVTFVENTVLVTAMDEARLNRERLSSILENTPALVSMKDPTGVYVYVNRKLAATLGSKPEELVGMTDEEIFGQGVGATMRERDFEVVKRRKAMEFEELVPASKIKGETGERWLASSKFPLVDAKNKVQSICTISLDVTERIRAQRTIQHQQEELARATKYSALGEIAAGISHELNTPLNVIHTKTDLLSRLAAADKLSGEKVTRVASDIERMVKNIGGIITGLKSIAGIDPQQIARVPLAQLLRDTLRICEHRLQRAGVACTLEIPSGPTASLEIECLPVQVSQIVINLVNNAADAVGGSKGAWIKVSLADEGSSAVIRVTDSGKGIDPAIAEKIMAPFFTTKREQKGTGLGLSLSRTIARQHGGDLVLDRSSPNTCFKLELPKKRVSE